MQKLSKHADDYTHPVVSGDGLNYTDELNLDEIAYIYTLKLSVGEKAEIYIAERYQPLASDFLIADLVDSVCVEAYDKHGICANDFIDLINLHSENIKSELKNALDIFVKSNNLEPDFYTVKQVKKITVVKKDNANYQDITTK